MKDKIYQHNNILYINSDDLSDILDIDHNEIKKVVVNEVPFVGNYYLIGDKYRISFFGLMHMAYTLHTINKSNKIYDLINAFSNYTKPVELSTVPWYKHLINWIKNKEVYV